MGWVGRLATRVFWPEARFSPAAWGIMRGMISFIIPAYNEERLLELPSTPCMSRRRPSAKRTN
jgi:hypothetical protein